MLIKIAIDDKLKTMGVGSTLNGIAFVIYNKLANTGINTAIKK